MFVVRFDLKHKDDRLYALFRAFVERTAPDLRLGPSNAIESG